ncbi:MAG TPA: hypothetical protein VEC16_04515 [Alphaproteobacteria bacterium]|nr:hypothetical protein [Alphaproteobacteria bacterium]
MTYNTGEIYSQSKELKDIVESYNWTLYETNHFTDAFTFGELEAKGPAKKYIIGLNYIFTPIKKENESLGYAYSITKGFGPMITIENPNDRKWQELIVMPKMDKIEAFFTRIYFKPNLVVLTTPKKQFLKIPDHVGVKYNDFIEMMKKDFKIVTPQEYGIIIPQGLPSSYN